MTATPTATPPPSISPNVPLLVFPSPTQLAASSHPCTMRRSKHWPRQ